MTGTVRGRALRKGGRRVLRDAVGGALATAVALTSAAAAVAADPGQPAQPGQPAAAASAPGAPASAQSEPPQTLGGDLGGLRTELAKAGLELGITYVGEGFAGVSGGTQRGAVYDGQILGSLDADLAKMAGWKGAKAHVDAFDVHGESPSDEFADNRNLMLFSSIESLPTLRLWTLWLEQSLFDDKLSIRLGQLAADKEFIISDTAVNLINATFGWPALTSSDMIQSGPGYPFSAPGVRLQVKPLSHLTMLAAAFSADVGGQGCTVNPVICNPYGVRFSFSGGTLWMSEAQYTVDGKRSPTGLPGTYKLGGWRETGTFTGQFNGARDKSSDWGLYALADQTLWQGSGKNKDQSLSAFVRVGIAPPDRNLVSLYVDGGVGWKAPLPGRPGDVLTLGAAYTGISPDAATADRLARPSTRVRDYEAVVELEYQAQIRPGWTVQPDLQYLMHPGGNIANPQGRGAIPSALVLGVRTTLTF